MIPATLYSFRRCPYAIRARLAIAASDITIELREVVLRNKPQELLDLSAKATVPVLVTADNIVIDESIDIMHWALRQKERHDWISDLDASQYSMATQLIERNDNEFKYFLDRYKYTDRYPEFSQIYYRQQAEKTLQLLEERLAIHDYLVSNTLSIADIALLPFIRQFAFVDKAWFDTSPYPLVQKWLNEFLNSALFERVMVKYMPWQKGGTTLYFP